jgi:hypothetical protein
MTLFYLAINVDKYAFEEECELNSSSIDMIASDLSNNSFVLHILRSVNVYIWGQKEMDILLNEERCHISAFHCGMNHEKSVFPPTNTWLVVATSILSLDLSD